MKIRRKFSEIKALINSSKSYKNACLVLVGTLLLATICEIKFLLEENNRTIYKIEREEMGGLIEEKALTLKLDQEDEASNINIKVDPLELRQEEVAAKWEELDKLLEKIILGENESAQNVTSKLDFKESVDGYPFILTYYPENEEYVSKEGDIGLAVPYEGSSLNILIKAKCLSPIYSAQKEITITVYNPDEKNGYLYRLSQFINNNAQQTKYIKEITLPKEFEGKSLLWQRKIDNKSGAILGIGFITALALVIGKKEEEEKERKRIQLEMEMTYPEVVSRLAMYLGAGMTVSSAFRRMAEVYEKSDDNNYLKKELIRTKREIESGISEADALKQMSNRCKISQISRLTSLIVQGSKRGSFGLKESLREETKDALQERKNNALRMGEQAGTKLLIPMILMLIMVMGIIMVPAFTSFGI